MKRKIIPTLLALALTASLAPAAFAAAPPSPCYPTSVTRSEDGAQIRKVYDLGPEEDPAGISRSDFQQEGFHYTLTDLLKQEAPEREERFHTETVTLDSKSKDMESVLALLPAQREFTTEDGLTGTLSLKLDTVQVDVAGYGSSTRRVSATRSYPNLAGQDTSYIPKEITDNGRTLELASIDWRTDNTANEDGYAVGDRFTAIATYTGSATSSYVKLEICCGVFGRCVWCPCCQPSWLPAAHERLHQQKTRFDPGEVSQPFWSGCVGNYSPNQEIEANEHRCLH